jgi:hypothetical protein
MEKVNYYLLFLVINQDESVIRDKQYVHQHLLLTRKYVKSKKFILKLLRYGEMQLPQTKYFNYIPGISKLIKLTRHNKATQSPSVSIHQLNITNVKSAH